MIAIISDIHVNYEALQAVLAALDQKGIEEIYCLGDVVGYYSQINECCDELRKRNVMSIMGNHDWYLASDGFCLRSKTADDCIQYQKKIITPENLTWIQSFPIYRKAGGMFFVHGGWGIDPIDEYLLDPSEDYFKKLSGNYFSSGHTHIQQLNKFGDKIYCNPGSVGQPRDNDNRAAFATWDENKHEFELHRVSYDFEKVGRLMEEAGFDGYYYERLAIGAKDNGWYKEKKEEKNV
jgi:predicted phosphodiesterase